MMLLVPLLLAAVLLAGLATAIAGYRASRRQALVDAIDTLRFNTYVALIRRVMARRGFTTECRLGTVEHGVYEFVARRDGQCRLVACKLGASVRFTTRHVLALDSARAAAGAAGAIVFTSGDVEDNARVLADVSGIEIVDGAAFRREVGGALGEDTVRDIRARTRAGLARHARRGLLTGLVCAAAGASAVALAMHV